MIQRIQTVWLLTAVAFLCVFCVVPLMQVRSAGKYTELAANNFFESLPAAQGQGTHSPVLLIAVAFVAALAGFAIFMYKSRRLQKITISVALLILVGIVMLMVYRTLVLKGVVDAHPGMPYVDAAPEIGALMPVFALICLWLAIAGITKDQKLLRSAERLR